MISEQSPLGEARRLREQGELMEAENLCRGYLPPDPGNDDPPSGLAEIGFMALLGLVRLQRGQWESGRRLVRAAGAAGGGLCDPEIDLDLAGGFMLLGELARSTALLERAKKENPDSGILHYRLGLLAMEREDIQQALSEFRRAVRLEPDRAMFHLALARVLLLTEEQGPALEQLRRAEAVAPDLRISPSRQYAELLVDLGMGDALFDRLSRLLDQPRVSPSQLLFGAGMAVRAEHPEMAEAFLRRAARVASENISVLTRLTTFLQGRERHREALAVLQSVIRIEPDDLELWMRVSEVATSLSHAPLARKASAEINRLFDSAPPETREDPGLASRVHTCRGWAEHCAGSTEAAERAFRRALALDPDNERATMGLGNALMVQGRIEEASAQWAGLSKKANEIGNVLLITHAHTLPEDPDALSEMARKAALPGTSDQMRQSLLSAIGRAYDKMGHYDEAFASIREANALERKKIQYDAAAQSRFIRRIGKVFNPGFFQGRNGYGHPSRLPIFVVGPPRSGTTLVEQILSSHSCVHGAGELSLIPQIARFITARSRQRDRAEDYPDGCMTCTRAEIGRMAAYYLNTVRQLDSRAGHVVDKLPHNFMHVGLIHLLFPNARIINCRRDPRDVAISNYFIRFLHKDGGMAFAYDLRDIGRLLCDYHHIMTHWHGVIPGRIIDIRYEELVGDPAPHIRRLLDFCGLDWEDSVLAHQENRRRVQTASLWQVRQPIYQTSRHRWERYSAHLTSLIEVLERHGYPYP